MKDQVFVYIHKDSFTIDHAYPLTDIPFFPINKGATYLIQFFSFAILRGVIEYFVLEKATLPTKTTFWKNSGCWLVVGYHTNPILYCLKNSGCWLVVGFFN